MVEALIVIVAILIAMEWTNRRRGSPDHLVCALCGSKVLITANNLCAPCFDQFTRMVERRNIEEIGESVSETRRKLEALDARSSD